MHPDSSLPPETPTVPLEERQGLEAGPPLAQPGMPIAPGTVIAGRYRLIAIVGEGGSGRVYEAVDLTRPGEARDGDIVALKVLTEPFDQTAGHYAALQAQFTRWRRLQHPYIVRLFDCERDGTIVYIVMEYVAGESLYTRLHRPDATAEPSTGTPEGDRSRLIIASVAQALAYAHQQGVVHGDLKPGNVLVDARGDVKVIDFALTRWLARPNGTRDERAAAATPRYASPQIMAGEKPRPSDDVYSLACVAYEMLTGVHPLEGSPDAAPRRPGLTYGEHRALLRALERDPAARTATIEKFAAEFAARSNRPRRIAWSLGLAAAAIVILGWVYQRHSVRPASTARAPIPIVSTPSIRAVPEAPAYRPGTLFRDCADCPSMTAMPAGRFRQGAADDESDALPSEQPAHWVQIGRPLAMSTTDITVDEFGRFAAATGRTMQGCDIYDGEWRHRGAASWSNPGFTQSGTHPVTCVSWNDAIAYAEWLSNSSGHRYRLPSASEWEYAARAGSDQLRPWRSDAASACASANVADRSAEQRYPGWSVFPCDDGYVYTAPSGSFAANAFGLRDMLGNVFVWTQDCWTADYKGAPADGSARGEAACRERELRGGSWFSAPAAVKASYRNHFANDYRTSSVGFRLVRELP
jgi:formylglycine-generating enzyme required for sulfatase activity